MFKISRAKLKNIAISTIPRFKSPFMLGLLNPFLKKSFDDKICNASSKV